MKKTVEVWNGCCPKCGEKWPEYISDENYDVDSEAYECEKCGYRFYVNLIRFDPQPL